MEAAAAATTFGDPRNPPIVFLHGIRLGREIWIPHAAALERQYHVIALDLPGHGALADVPFTERNVADLLDDVIANIAGRPSLIVGYSLGGFVAMRHAARNPEQTAGLLLADCTFDFEGWRWWPYGAWVNAAQHLPAAWLDAMQRLGLYATLPHNWVDVVQRIPFNRNVLLETSEIVRSSRNALDEVASYRKPVSIVNGEYDLLFRLDEKRFLHRLPQARLQIMRGMDHAGPLRRIAEFTSIVEAFARRVFATVPPT